MLCPQIKDAGHELAVCIAEAAPDMLLGDKRRLERILLNLIVNSVQHTAAGGKTVLCISCAQGDRVEKLPLVFTVSDNGEGMEQSILDATLAEGETPAAGLGIAIAKGLTELMGGSIAAKSGREKGTVFRVELAFDRMEEKEKTEAESEALAGKRLLLAEDDRLCGEILCELLEDETGRPVSITANGRAALEMFESANGEYDAIIMDVQMPVMNGYEAARAIRMSGCGNAKTVPIIALTADASEESARAAADSGMNGCLAKPVNIDRLRKAVAAALKSLSVAYR